MNRRVTSCPASAGSQRGAVLITTVLMLILLTLGALAAVSMNSTQTRVATNSADNQVSYQTAEGALSEAKTKLLAGVYSAAGFAANTNGLYVFDPAVAPVWTDPSIWITSGAVIQGFQGGSSAGALYLIEKLPPVTKPGQSMKTPLQVYRITARAVGKSGRAPVVLQATVQVQ